MSLVSDPAYLVHNLRLSYLRNVDDPYGGRIISLSPSYTSNPYIVVASLADVNRWPELEYPSSPPISDDEGDHADNDAGPSGPGGARLKHHQTIMGSRSGAFGMRVNGNRVSTSKRASRLANRLGNHNEDIMSTPHATVSHAAPTGPSESDSCTKPPDVEVTAVSAPRSLQKEQIPPEPITKEVPFVPKFKGAAEMEARRKLRMLARRGPPTSPPKPVPVHLNSEVSSEEEDEGGEDEEEEEALLDEEDDDFDLGEHGDDIMDEGDEFDPDFAATRSPGAGSDSASDIASIISGTASVVSISNPPVMPSSFVSQHARTRSRLSPVSEGYGVEPQENLPTIEHPEGSTTQFEIVKPPPPPQALPLSQRPDHPPAQPTRRRGVSVSQPIADVPAAEMTFTRYAVAPSRQQASALTAMLASSSSSSNPFTELYGAISGRGESAAMDVRVFFPHARQPSGDVMLLNVRKDATVEEVIGFALWTYWEEGWLPKLNEGASEDDPKLSAVGWVLRIAEDDGEVDEDFPPPDRTGKISKFNFDAFAILEATPMQIQQNEQLESKIQRRPSRVMAAPKKLDTLPATVPPSIPKPGTSALFGTTPVLSSSLGPSSSQGPPIFLRVRVEDTADAAHISTTIPVSAGMYMQEALELVCRKRKLANPKDYALILNDLNILIYLDRTVASLEGKRELTLVKRSMLPQLGIEPESRAARTTDPNASIFKRISEVPDQSGAATDYTTAYKRYTIYRKLPMLARQERTLAIDGVYIHIMPSANKAKAVFDSGKTLSFHIKSVVVCQQSQKSSTLFKIVVQRDSRNKRYDFEADTPKLAGEIVHAIRSLKATLDRSVTVNRSRRSRQVG